MRILITGSRTWQKEMTIRDAIEDQWLTTLIHEQNTLVHGGAAGADTMAAKWGDFFAMDIEGHLADWQKHGKRAGFVRNAEMVALGADVCLAFIRDESKDATMTADLAEKAGIHVIRFKETS